MSVFSDEMLPITRSHKYNYLLPSEMDCLYLSSNSQIPGHSDTRVPLVETMTSYWYLPIQCLPHLRESWSTLPWMESTLSPRPMTVSPWRFMPLRLSPKASDFHLRVQCTILNFFIFLIIFGKQVRLRICQKIAKLNRTSFRMLCSNDIHIPTFFFFSFLRSSLKIKVWSPHQRGCRDVMWCHL